MDRSELTAAAQPNALKEALDTNASELRAGHHAQMESMRASLRTASYKGHEIVIRTTYEITVDGKPFETHVIVDNSGRVHYHGLPTRDFASTVDLVKKVIDLFPNDFPPDDGSASGDQPQEHSGQHHEAHEGP